ncbi:thiamine pyrophosphate-binding protein [Longispora urticae]
MILADYLHDRLRAAGVTRAFGVPGYFVMPVWQTFAAEPDIVLARHESGAAFMADGHSRVTGELGVVLATIGPGMTNCVTGVACAYRDSVPMLVITGQAPTATFGRGAFLESYVLDRAVSPAALFAPITKKSIEIVDPANAAFLIDAAISLALSGRPGPVHLSVPVDLQQAEIPVPEVRPARVLPVPDVRRGGQVAAEGDLVATAAGLLADAERPLILAGWGAVLAGAHEAVAGLAAELGAVVVTSTKAVSLLPAAHPWRLGHLGPGQRSDLVPALREYRPDVVLVLGASLSTFYTAPVADLLAEATVVRVDLDADQLPLRGRADLALVADVADAVAAVRSVLADRTPPDRDAARELVAAFQRRGAAATAAQPLAFKDTVSMAGTVALLSSLLPSDAVVVPDAGNHWLDTIALHPAPRAGGLHLNCGIGAMGWAIGASIGIAFARPGRRTVCVTGDGSVLMSGGEFSVAAEHGLDLLAVVFNNRSHGRVRLGQQLDFAGDPIGTDIPEVDFASWMAAMGLRTFRIERPEDVEPVLRAALATPGAVGVEVLCHPDEVPACLRDWVGETP